jgi:hypothetical protein
MLCGRRCRYVAPHGWPLSPEWQEWHGYYGYLCWLQAVCTLHSSLGSPLWALILVGMSTLGNASGDEASTCDSLKLRRSSPWPASVMGERKSTTSTTDMLRKWRTSSPLYQKMLSLLVLANFESTCTAAASTSRPVAAGASSAAHLLQSSLETYVIILPCTGTDAHS